MFQKPIIPMAAGCLLALTAAANAAPGGECDDRETVAQYSDCMIERAPVGEPALRASELVAVTHTGAMKIRDWYAGWFIEKWDRDDLVIAHDERDPIGPTVASGDDLVDESDGEEEDDDWEWLRVLIAILIGASEQADDIVYNSTYDGEIHSPGTGTSANAVLQLRRLGDDVTATLWTDGGLVVDTSWFLTCPDIDVPAGVFPFTATMDPATQATPTPLRATGSLSRSLSLAGVGAGSVAATYSLEVLSDLDHLVADVAIATPIGCSNTALTGTFTRRIGSQYQ